MLLPDLVRAARIAGIDVSVAYLREKDGSPAARRLRALGVEPVWLGVGGLLRPASLRKVHRHVAAVQPDVVHSHLGYSDLLGGLAAGALGVPVISTIHVTRWDESIRGRVKSALFDATRRATANRVVTVSDAARVAFLEQGWGPRGRVMTMHNCIAGDVRPGTGRQVRAELGIGPDQLVVGMVSVLRHGKGHRVAARAMERVRMRAPEARLVVLGDGPARADVETALAPLGDGAVMAGHRDDVMNVLDAVDVFLLPSEHEAFPTALLEAMAAGVPIVASAVGGVAEIVVDGVTGRLVAAPASAESVSAALLELLESRTMRERMGDAGRERFQLEFSLEPWAHRLRLLYESVLTDQPPPGQRLGQTFRRAHGGIRRYSRGSSGR